MTKADLHRLIDELPEDVVDGTALLLRGVARRDIDPDQAWFWTRDWQEGEREADKDLSEGRFTRFEGDAAFLEHLEELGEPRGRAE